MTMKQLTTAVLVTIGMLIAPVAAAGTCSGIACSDIALDMLYINSNGVLVATAGTETGLTCTPNSNVYLTLPKTHGNYSAIFSTLQAALIAGRPVSIRIDDGSVGCTIAYITIKG